VTGFLLHQGEQLFAITEQDTLWTGWTQHHIPRHLRIGTMPEVESQASFALLVCTCQSLNEYTANQFTTLSLVLKRIDLFAERSFAD
jgi:hypothetical protein